MQVTGAGEAMPTESGVQTAIPGSCPTLHGRGETQALAATAVVCQRVLHVTRRLWAMRRRLCLLAGGLLAAAWIVGLWLFLRAGSHTPATVILPARKPHPPGEHNLVQPSYGVELRASSYYRDRSSHHHPAFLVDGRPRPSLVEKWASDPTDAQPWIELLWTGERELSRVRVQHAGHVENGELTARRYTLTCLSPRAPPPLLVTDNQASVSAHELPCSGARGLRIDFAPNRPGELVRVFEVEVWGR